MKNQLDEALPRSLHARLDALEIPPIDLYRIAARPVAREPRTLPRYAVALAACAVIALTVFATSDSVKALGSSIRVNLTRDQGMILAKLFGYKRPVHMTLTDEVTYKGTTLERARRELPFPVITPGWLPPGFHPSSVELGGDRSVVLTYVPTSEKHDWSRTAISLTERVAKPGQRSRDTSGGFSAHFNPNGTLSNAHLNDPQRYVGSEFSVGRTHLVASIQNMKNARSVMQALKASMRSR
jgi:hypothetical protein